MTNILPIEFNDAIFDKYVSLFRACFPKSIKYSKEYLKWLYCKNPAGLAVGFDAWEDGELAAHYVCIPMYSRIGGDIVRTLLSLNTATHPKFQGKGLFVKLATMTYSFASDQGFDCVYGVANDNSTPGFVRKLGFGLVDSLQARIGIGQVIDNRNEVIKNVQFEMHWSQLTLDWRCDNPNNKVISYKDDDLLCFNAIALGRFVPAYAQLSADGGLHATGIEKLTLSPFRLFIGLIPQDAADFRKYIDIPRSFRPSPLNFIYKSLSKKNLEIDNGSVSLSFLDFDAY